MCPFTLGPFQLPPEPATPGLKRRATHTYYGQSGTKWCGFLNLHELCEPLLSLTSLSFLIQRMGLTMAPTDMFCSEESMGVC